jgi:hypothetical protein
MRDPLSRAFSSLQPSQDSWFHRVRDNFRQLLLPAYIFPSSANGAPLHLLTFRRTASAGGARTASLLTHAALLSGILLLHSPSHAPGVASAGPELAPHSGLSFFSIAEDSHIGRPSLGKKSGGGEDDRRPTRHGFLAPGSSVPLAPPRRPINAEPALPVPVSVFDSNAPQFPTPVTNLGLPWMKNNSDSAGPGKKHGFGSGTDAAAWVMTKDLAPDRAKLTMVPTRMSSLRRGAPIVPIPNIPKKRGRPSYREP